VLDTAEMMQVVRDQRYYARHQYIRPIDILSTLYRPRKGLPYENLDSIWKSP
jgi:hypothetical protein